MTYQYGETLTPRVQHVHATRERIQILEHQRAHLEDEIHRLEALCATERAQLKQLRGTRQAAADRIWRQANPSPDITWNDPPGTGAQRLREAAAEAAAYNRRKRTA